MSTSEMQFVQGLASKVAAAEASRSATRNLEMETPAYAIDLEAELMRRLARPPKVPKPKLESRSQQIHAKLLRQVEATRARVARSDISLTELLDGRSDRFPSSPRCIWHGSGAAAVTGVAPLYYEGPDCEYTSVAALSLEASLDTVSFASHQV